MLGHGTSFDNYGGQGNLIDLVSCELTPRAQGPKAQDLLPGPRELKTVFAKHESSHDLKSLGPCRIRIPIYSPNRDSLVGKSSLISQGCLNLVLQRLSSEKCFCQESRKPDSCRRKQSAQPSWRSGSPCTRVDDLVCALEGCSKSGCLGNPNLVH